jgi:hypothetical protein
LGTKGQHATSRAPIWTYHDHNYESIHRRHYFVFLPFLRLHKIYSKGCLFLTDLFGVSYVGRFFVWWNNWELAIGIQRHAFSIRNFAASFGYAATMTVPTTH